MKKFYHATLLVILTSGAVLTGWTQPVVDPASNWRPAAPGYQWEFPRDFASHPEYKTEWWYVTGHLFPEGKAQPGDDALAFQMTFFRIGLIPDGQIRPASDWATKDLVMAHASVADPALNSHRFSEVLHRANGMLGGFGAPADSTLAWCQAPAGTAGLWTLVKNGDSFHLKAADDRQGFAYDLICTPRNELTFHGLDGFSPKSANGQNGSLYFSYTRMDVTGSVTIGNQTISVRGQSWLDREIFSSSLAPDQVGWDWVSLQLDDGRDLMLYRLRGESEKADFALGTLVAADGTSVSLPADQWSLEPLTRWTSPETESEYPVSWRLQIPKEGIDLKLKAIMPDQENISPRSGVHYWEGAVIAHPNTPDGSAPILGRGFVELTGYGQGSRPPV